MVNEGDENTPTVKAPIPPKTDMHLIFVPPYRSKPIPFRIHFNMLRIVLHITKWTHIQTITEPNQTKPYQAQAI